MRTGNHRTTVPFSVCLLVSALLHAAIIALSAGSDFTSSGPPLERGARDPRSPVELVSVTRRASAVRTPPALTGDGDTPASPERVPQTTETIPPPQPVERTAADEPDARMEQAASPMEPDTGTPPEKWGTDEPRSENLPDFDGAGRESFSSGKDPGDENAPVRAGIPDAANRPVAADPIDALVADVTRRLEEEKTYPLSARRRKLEGTVTLSLSVGPEGELREVSVDESAGSSLLDGAAVRLAEKVFPLPAGIGREARILVAVSYRLE